MAKQAIIANPVTGRPEGIAQRSRKKLIVHTILAILATLFSCWYYTP